MYRIILNDVVVGTYENVRFIKKSGSGCFVECDKTEADGIFAGGKIYALTNSEDYKDYDMVSLFELDSEVNHSSELDYIRAMSGLV